MKGDLPLSHMPRLMDMCMLPVLTYGTQSKLLTEAQNTIRTRDLPENYGAQHIRCKTIASYPEHHAALNNPNCRCSSEGGQVEMRLG